MYKTEKRYTPTLNLEECSRDDLAKMYNATKKAANTINEITRYNPVGDLLVSRQALWAAHGRVSAELSRRGAFL